LGAPAVGLAGHSRGGAIALIHAVEDPRVRAVALLATPRAIGVWPEEYYRSWERGEDALFLDFRTVADIQALGERCDLTRAMAALAAPALLVQGDRDRQVTVDEARALARSGASNLTELRVIEGAGHGFQAADVLRRTPAQLLEMTDAVAAWMRRWLGSRPPPVM
jgi:pimeloyl-ACP methyl ester carboxylesterase